MTNLTNSRAAGTFSSLDKLWKGKKYLVPAASLQRTLGVALKGNDIFQHSGKPKTRRGVCLPFVEGAIAVLMGNVTRAVLPPASSSIWCQVSLVAYMDVTSAPAQTRDVIVGIDRDTTTIYNTIASSSGSGGKTDFTVYPLALLDAAYRLTKGDRSGVALLEAHLKLADYLKTMNELPVTGNSNAAAQVRSNNSPLVKSTLETLFRAATDEAYEFLTFGVTTTGLRAVPNKIFWHTELAAAQTPPGWRPGMADITTLFTDPDELKGFIADGLWPRPAAGSNAAGAQPAASPGAGGQPAAPRQSRGRNRQPATAAPPAGPAPAPAVPVEPHVRILRATALMRAGEGGPLSFLLQGPPGGGKTYSVTHAGDGIPTESVVWSDAPVEPLVAELSRNLTGAWTPTLGLLGSVVRLSMLAALRIALKRGAAIAEALATHHGTRSAELLAALARDPDDKTVLADLDDHALPFYTEAWQPVSDAYFESGAAEVGAVYRFVFDEVFGLSKNKGAEQLLKALLANRRPLKLPGAGWHTLYALNVHFVGLGNSSIVDKLNAAVISRFGAVMSLQHPSEAEEVRRMRHAREKADEAAKGKTSVPRPASLRLVDHVYEPPVPKMAVNVSAAADSAVYKLAQYTREEFGKGRFREPIDPRGTEQLAVMIGHLVADGMSERDAFTTAAQCAIAKVATVDPIWGLPSAQDRNDLVKQITTFAQTI